MRRRARRGGGRQVELVIEGLGARGDGFARLDGRLVFVPFTLAGDRVRVRLTGTRGGDYKAEVLELLDEGPGRVEPPCPHFGTCGGCGLQHLSDAAYGEWKRGLMGQALAQRGLHEVSVAPLVRIAPGTRRRATLAATRNDSNVTLGFHGRESHQVVNLETCLVLTPGLTALLPALRVALLPLLAPREVAALSLCESETGIDLLIVSATAPNLAAREALAALAEAQDLARLSWAGRPAIGAVPEPEPVVLRRPPVLSFAGVPVALPPGGFLQPTEDGEAALAACVLAYLPEGAETIAELYAGCGSFTFPLAKFRETVRIHAVERDEAALAALWAAARKSDLAGRITVTAQDLARAPVLAEDLEGGDCVVFDPPRAGAREQAAEIARSSVPAAVAVSCNPKTFARDARTLVDGGFTLVEVTPVDQFPWTGHLELVAQFRR
ncbi:MAG: class I SAM-dependent RNA methyltransferase [Alphaproteobacteria bacterium]